MATTTGIANFSLYPYDPVKPLPFVFAAIILILGVVNAYQNIVRYKWTRLGFGMVVATVVWVTGFGFRAVSQYHHQDITLYIIQFVFILLGPAMYAAAEMFILGRLLAYLPYHSPLHPGRVVLLFIYLDIAVQALTANGASKVTGRHRTQHELQQAYDCIKAGLLVQAVLELFFFNLVVYLHLKCRQSGDLRKNVKTMIFVLYLTSSMVFLRCILRAVEAFQASGCDRSAPGYNGFCGAIELHEWYLWVFEVGNITLFVAVLTYFTPGYYLPVSDRVFLDPHDHTTERLGPGFQDFDKRPTLRTYIDPLNIQGLLTGKRNSSTPFWDLPQPEYVGQEGLPDRRKTRRAIVEHDGKVESVTVKHDGKVESV